VSGYTCPCPKLPALPSKEQTATWVLRQVAARILSDALGSDPSDLREGPRKGTGTRTEADRG